MPGEPSEERLLADRFSSYADAIAAAAFVNALAFFVAMTEREVRCSMVHLQELVAGCAIALHAGYLLAIWACRRAELRLRATAPESSGPLVQRYRHGFHLARLGFVACVGLATAAVSWFTLGDPTCP